MHPAPLALKCELSECHLPLLTCQVLRQAVGTVWVTKSELLSTGSRQSCPPVGVALGSGAPPWSGHQAWARPDAPPGDGVVAAPGSALHPAVLRPASHTLGLPRAGADTPSPAGSVSL